MQSDALAAMLPADCARKTGILDANLLVLLISSLVDESLLKTFKRIKQFTPDDVLLLAWLLRQFKAMVTTSYALAEASNLANELSGYKRMEWYQQLASFTRVTEEAHVATKVVGANASMEIFGVTDAALSELCASHVLLTTEYRLSGHLVAQGKNVLNFNHFRTVWI